MPTCHSRMRLRARERVLAARLADCEAQRDPWHAGGAQTIRIEADAVADAARVRATEAERQRDRLVGYPRHDPHRRFERTSIDAKRHHVFVHHAELPRETRRK